MSDEKGDKTKEIEIPKHIIISIAKALLPEIRNYYSNNTSSFITEIKEMDNEKRCQKRFLLRKMIRIRKRTGRRTFFL